MVFGVTFSWISLYRLVASRDRAVATQSYAVSMLNAATAVALALQAVTLCGLDRWRRPKQRTYTVLSDGCLCTANAHPAEVPFFWEAFRSFSHANPLMSSTHPLYSLKSFFLHDALPVTALSCNPFMQIYHMLA